MNFTWEFPPRIVGQLAGYVNWLASELVKRKVEVYVITYNDSWIGYNEGPDGIRAYRISDHVRPQINVLTWMLSLNQEAERVSADIYYSNGRSVDVLDVHDWHFVPAAVSLKRAFDVPFVFSIDSIEPHRSHNSNSPLSLSIGNIERLATVEADAVIAKSDWMKREVTSYFKTEEKKIQVVSPNSGSLVEQVLSVYRNLSKAASI